MMCLHLNRCGLVQYYVHAQYHLSPNSVSPPPKNHLPFLCESYIHMHLKKTTTKNTLRDPVGRALWENPLHPEQILIWGPRRTTALPPAHCCVGFCCSRHLTHSLPHSPTLSTCMVSCGLWTQCAPMPQTTSINQPGWSCGCAIISQDSKISTPPGLVIFCRLLVSASQR